MASSAKIISKEMVKPSSPTPTQLRNLKLSSLDRLIPPIYIPLIFFYKSKPPQLQQSLKKSLSNALTKFYPLAGRFCRDKSTLDCSDLGALFVECKIEGNMLEVIKNPTMEELQKLLPPVESNNNGDIILAVQINLFDCGGIAVAVQMHHKAGDANSLVCFMNAWAETSRGGDDVSSPIFDLATLFPPIDHMFCSVSEPPSWQQQVPGKIVSKLLVFDKKDVENLKLQESKVIKDPTRVEAVSSFLMKRFRDAFKARGSKKPLAILHAVNLRPRMDPPLPNNVFGNVGTSAVAELPGDGELVGVLRNSIRKIDGDYVKEMQHGNELLNYLNNFKALCLKMEPWYFSSWARFPVYAVDYGWGRPMWVTGVLEHVADKNVVLLMSTSCGEGMEAWVNMLQEDAASIDFRL